MLNQLELFVRDTCGDSLASEVTHIEGSAASAAEDETIFPVRQLDEIKELEAKKRTSAPGSFCECHLSRWKPYGSADCAVVPG